MPIEPWDIAIDVSDNNTIDDWGAVYASGIRIAFIKIMENPASRYPSGPLQTAGARAAGLVAVPYAFLRACDPKAAVREFAARADLGPGMPFMLDWEGRASQTCAPQICEAIGEGLALIANRKPVGYWGIAGATPARPTAKMQLWERLIPRYPAISGIANWLAVPASWRDAPATRWRTGDAGRPLPVFGQYTSSGRVAGIRGDVDRSVAFFPSIADALAWCGLAPAAAGAAVAQETPKAPLAATPVAEIAPPAPAAPAAAPTRSSAAERDDSDAEAEDLNAEELDRLHQG